MLANIDQVEISFLCGKNSKLTFVHLVEYHTSAFLILWKKVVTVSCMTNGSTNICNIFTTISVGPPTELLQGYQGEELGVHDCVGVIVVSCYIISYHTGFKVLELNIQN